MITFIEVSLNIDVYFRNFAALSAGRPLYILCGFWVPGLRMLPVTVPLKPE